MSAKDLTRVIVSNLMSHAATQRGWHGECGAQGEVEDLNLCAEEGKSEGLVQLRMLLAGQAERCPQESLMLWQAPDLTKYCNEI